MKRIVSTAAVAALLMSGCTSFTGLQPATPPDYTGPTVNVADQVRALGPQQLHIFEMVQVDGRRLASSSMATTRAGQGGGMTVAPVALTNEMPLQTTRVRLQATTQFPSPLVALSHPACRTIGDVTFTPEEGKRYIVNGRIEQQVCDVWIEEAGSGRRASETVTGPGTDH